ncbi:GmrSD restriction endonuclease domain-containing protein [Crocosphaera sp.]|uniref:GmrSD restriction endonuclease domain-containing protein n=1 Tax=Crocosphaera sp. TaxID=2729996 RepID=UPI003F24C384
MELPQPQTKTFASLVEAIKNGQIKIPQFQRDFVWTMQKSAGLIDSLIKGYPIGTFIFWRTKESKN